MDEQPLGPVPWTEKAATRISGSEIVIFTPCTTTRTLPVGPTGRPSCVIVIIIITIIITLQNSVGQWLDGFEHLHTAPYQAIEFGITRYPHETRNVLTAERQKKGQQSIIISVALAVGALCLLVWILFYFFLCVGACHEVSVALG